MGRSYSNVIVRSHSNVIVQSRGRKVHGRQGQGNVVFWPRPTSGSSLDLGLEALSESRAATGHYTRGGTEPLSTAQICV